jgi:ribonucleoside-diphosphate reductase alpha chain
MMFRSEMNPMFRSKFSEDIFNAKYAHEGCESWAKLSKVLADDVCGPATVDGETLVIMDESDIRETEKIIHDLKFIPGGRYLYYAGRPKKFFNNCYLLRALEDTREDWADLSWRVESCLMTGGGIGVDYSVYRPSGARLKGTGGFASGPIPKMYMVNEIGRNVMQGGTRRSAIYASLNWQHGDIQRFLKAKNWHDMPVPGTKLSLADL